MKLSELKALIKETYLTEKNSREFDFGGQSIEYRRGPTKFMSRKLGKWIEVKDDDVKRLARDFKELNRERELTWNPKTRRYDMPEEEYNAKQSAIFQKYGYDG